MCIDRQNFNQHVAHDCYVQVKAPDGPFMKARALLDSASSASFVSERLAQALNLPRSSQTVLISGVAGLVRSSPIQSLASLKIATTCPPWSSGQVVAILRLASDCIGELLTRPATPDMSTVWLERGRFNAWASLSETKDAEDALSRSARAFMKGPSGAFTWT